MWKMMVHFAVAAALLPRGESLYGLPKGREDPKLQIMLPNGLIQGRDWRADDGTTFYAYQGIPYAAPPVGNLRFKPPMPAHSWDGILDCTMDADICMQTGSDDIPMSEDCLYANVYTPRVNSIMDISSSNHTSLAPVMVWIYGGAFLTGHSRFDTYGPEYLLQQGVVVVTFNYRLGIFGFLSTNDLYSPGNYGIKDQIAALRWIQTNINRFGGDPKNVTIFGESAGAASVSYLLLAPQAKGLFHKAISESGSALCPWALQRNPRIIALEVGTVLGIITIDTEELVEKLRGVDASLLRSISGNAAILNLISPLNGLAYSPTIEPKHEDAVLTAGAHELFSTGNFNKVPYIIGFNSEESSVLQELVDYLRVYLLSYDVAPTNLVPDDMNVAKLSLNYIQAGLKIRLHYFGLVPTSLAKRKDILQFISDIQFVKPIRESVKQIAQYVPVYFYQFSYEGSLGIRGVNIDKPLKNDAREVTGVGHSEEMWYLWKRKALNIKSGYDADKARVFQKLWTNFAKYGNPTPTSDPILGNITWPKSGLRNQFKYLDINDDLEVLSHPKQDAMEFWDGLYKDYGSPPYDTY